jgi:hypothetical protein
MDCERETSVWLGETIAEEIGRRVDCAVAESDGAVVQLS